MTQTARTAEAAPTLPEARGLIPFETFDRLARRAAAETRGGPATDGDILGAEVRPALAAWFERLHAAGHLRPVPGGAGHSTPFLRAWDGFVRGDPTGRWETPERRLRTIVDSIEAGAVMHHYLMAGIRLRDKPAETFEPAIRAAYEEMVEGLERGEIPDFLARDEECAVDGHRYKIAWSGWNPRMGRWRDRGLVPMEPLERAPHREVEVTFETGDLVIADWIRIPEFTAVVDPDEFSEEVGYADGREAMTERYAREHGFVGVHVGGAYATVFERDGCLVVGKPDPDAEPDAPRLGSMSGGYRGATIIDRARLVAILAGRLGPAAAEARVAAYLADPGEDVLRARIEPGTYRLYFSGEPYAFQDGFRAADLDLDRLCPRMVLSPRELDLDAAPGMAP